MAVVQKWSRFLKFLKFTSAITKLEEETFTEYISIKFQAFAEKLLLRQLVGDLLIATETEYSDRVTKRVLRYGQRLQAKADQNHG